MTALNYLPAASYPTYQAEELAVMAAAALCKYVSVVDRRMAVVSMYVLHYHYAMGGIHVAREELL
jgi:hypothetical protein